MKNRNFKIAAIVMAAVMTCSLTACTENKKNNDDIQNTEGIVSTPANTEDNNTDGEIGTPEESKAPEGSSAPEDSKAPEESTAAENGGSADEDKIQSNTTDRDENTDSKKGEPGNKDIQFNSNPVPLITETGKGEAIAKLAAAQTGVMYKFACATPDKGFDNSGLMYYVLTENGISCPRLNRDISQLGSKIKYDQLQIGDLAFFEYDDDGTVIIYGGVYLGDGKMAISMSDGIPVKIVDITTKYYKNCFIWGICVAR